MRLLYVVAVVAFLSVEILGDATVPFPDGEPIFAKHFDPGSPHAPHGIQVEECDDVHLMYLDDLGWSSLGPQDWSKPYNYVRAKWDNGNFALDGDHLVTGKNDVPLYGAFWGKFSIFKNRYSGLIVYLYRPEAVAAAYKKGVFSVKPSLRRRRNIKDAELPAGYDYKKAVRDIQRSATTDQIHELFKLSIQMAVDCTRKSLPKGAMGGPSFPLSWREKEDKPEEDLPAN